MLAKMPAQRKDVSPRMPHVIDVNGVCSNDKIVTKTKNNGLNHNFQNYVTEIETHEKIREHLGCLPFSFLQLCNKHPLFKKSQGCV